MNARAIDSSNLPVPPIDLIARVIPPFTSDQADGVREGFAPGGALNVACFERALATIGRTFADFERILDFGCGPGRIMRHLGEVGATSELHGTDIDADMIAWCADNLPFARFTVGPHEPPLPYEDGMFDLVFNHSVFTHIDAARQDLWLAEMRRILRPGGIALLSAHSTRQFTDLLTSVAGAGEDVEAYRVPLERDGILFISDDSFIGTTHPDWYHSTFHAPWYLYEHWSEFLTLRAHIHEGAITQDLLVLERPVDDAAPLTLIRHRAPASATPAAAPQPLASEPSIAGEARSLLGRAKRRALPELARHGALEHELAGLRTELEQERVRSTTEQRTISMMRVALYQQGDRISALERELRDEITRLGRGS